MSNYVSRSVREDTTFNQSGRPSNYPREDTTFKQPRRQNQPSSSRRKNTRKSSPTTSDRSSKSFNFRGKDIAPTILVKQGKSATKAKGQLDIGNLTPVEKLTEAVNRSGKHLAPEVAEEIKALFTPATIGMLMGVFAVYAVASLTGFSQGLTLAMGIAGLVFFGLDAVAILTDLAGFAGAVNATSEQELEEAGKDLASLVAKVGVDTLMTLLTGKIAQEIGKSVDNLKQVDEVHAHSEGANRSGGNLDNADNINVGQISNVDNVNGSIGIETERTSISPAATELDENYKFTNTTGNWSRELGINHYKTGKIVKQMSSSEIGQRVVDAANADEINLTLSIRTDVPKKTKGMSTSNYGTAYVYNTQSYDEIVLTLIHEGLHAMGVGGSRRAEALVRLAELEHQGIPINRKTIRQVLKEIKDEEDYDYLKWRIGEESPHFPGLKF